MIDFNLLKIICETAGAPGYEDRVRALVSEEIRPLVDEVYVDSMGSLVGVVKGEEDKRVMIGAHMDEISFIVSHIDDNGFIRFRPLGGFDPKTLTAQRVIIHAKEDIIGVMGSKPIHIMKGEERNKAPQMEDYYIDCGYTDADKLKEIVSIGDTITRDRSLIEIGECVNGKSLDNRVSVYILIEVLKRLKSKNQRPPHDIYAVFTVQEEVGLRGAINAAGHINPHFGFGLDVTIAYDCPGAAKHDYITELGKGTAIKILDGSTICDRRMVDYLKQLADQNEVPWQAEILPAGGTDTAGIQRFGKVGAIAGAISIPLRHMHTVIENVHKADIKASIDLLELGLMNLDQYDWSL